MRRKRIVVYGTFLVIIFVAFALSCTDEKPEVSGIIVTPSEIEFEAEGGSSIIHITCDAKWEISNVPDWFSLSKSASKGNDSVVVIALANEDTVARSVTIKITAGDTKEILISQKN